jgi:hypothetical protein
MALMHAAHVARAASREHNGGLMKITHDLFDA